MQKNKGSVSIGVAILVGLLGLALGVLGGLLARSAPLGFTEELNQVRFREVASINLVEAGLSDSLLAAKTDHSTLTPEEFCDNTLVRAAASSGNMTITLPNLASTTSEARGCLLVDGASRNLIFFGSGSTTTVVTVATGTGWTTLQTSASSSPFTFGQTGGGILKAVRTSATAGLLFYEQWAAR